MSVFSVTVAISATGNAISTAEVFTPCLQKAVLMLGHEFMNADDFRTRKSPAFLQPNWIKPNLGYLVFPFDVYVRWFFSMVRSTEVLCVEMWT